MQRKRRFSRRLLPKPVELGKEYEVNIEETSCRGQGIARKRVYNYKGNRLEP